MQKNILALLLVAFVAASCGNTQKDQKADLNDKRAQLEKLKAEQKKLSEQIAQLEAEIGKADPASARAEKAKLVQVAAVQPANFSHYIDLQGKVDAQNMAYVAPPNGQGGIVKALYVKQGQYVRKGQVLARLDDQLIRQQIAPLQVQLSAAEDTYRRTKSLWDQGIGTYQQVLTAQTQVETLRKQIGVIQQQAALMTVTAPWAGVADQVNVRVGEMFVGSTPAGPQIRIVNNSDLKIVAEVPENYLSRVREGSVLEVQLPETGRTLTTKINVVGRTINPDNRSFYIEARIPADAKLKPGQIAVVKIRDYAKTDAITIPVNTLQNDEKGKFVMVAVNEKGRTVARKRQVAVGELYNDQLEVKSGLQPGDTLITEGFQGLYDGQLVTTDVK